MIPYKYTYLVGCSVFLFIWLIIFLSKPKLRSEMAIMGAAGLFIGPLINNLLFLKDWWNPLYAAGTQGSIEDFLLGFTNISLASVVYKFVFDQNSPFKFSKDIPYITALLSRLVALLCITSIPLFTSFYIFHFHSFWSNGISLLIGGFYVLYKRPDLSNALIWSSILLPIISLPAFIIAEQLSPGWIANFWYVKNLSGIKLWVIPIEDLLWYMFSGFCFGGLFNYVFDVKISNNESKSLNQ